MSIQLLDPPRIEPARICPATLFALDRRTGLPSGAGARILERFVTEELQDAAPVTIQNYKHILRDVLRHLAEHEIVLPMGTVKAIEPLVWMLDGQAVFGLAPDGMQMLRVQYKELLQKYLGALAARQSHMSCYKGQPDQAPTVSHHTVTRYATVLRRFFAWYEERYGLVSPARRLKAPKSPAGQRRRQRNQRLSDNQAVQLLQYADALPTTLIGRRDRALIYLLLYSGRRTVELARADVHDLAVENGRRVLWYQGKGHASKDAFGVLHPEAATALDGYLSLRRTMHDHAALFPSYSDRSRGQRLTTRTISFIVKQAMKSIGLAEAHVYTAHGLRRTFTSHLCDRGVDDHAIADARGDSSLGMVRVYRQTNKRLADPAELKIHFRR